MTESIYTYRYANSDMDISCLRDHSMILIEEGVFLLVVDKDRDVPNYEFYVPEHLIFDIYKF